MAAHDIDPGAPDAAERAAYRALLCEVGSPALRQRLDARAEDCGPALVLRSRGLDHVLFNRVFGADEAGADSAVLAESVVARFRAQGIAHYFVHLRQDAAVRDHGLRERLGALGLIRYPRVWHEFVRGRQAVQPQPCALSIARATAADAQDVAQLVVRGFGLPAAACELLAAAVSAPEFHLYAAHAEDGQPVAALLMHARGDLAHLSAAATEPTHQRRGAQTALIARALRDALDLGCRSIAAETGAPIADEPNPSHHNLTRAGFRIAAVREHYAPAGARF